MKIERKEKVVHRIVQGDCLEKMAAIPSQSIDFICSDFPYNISNNPGLTTRWKKVVKADFWEWDKFESQDMFLKFVFDVCKEYKRILKKKASMVLFFSYRQAGWIWYELERKWLFTFRTPIIFNKNNPQPHYRKNGFRSCYEMGIWLVNDDAKFSSPKTFNFLEQKEMTNVMNYYIGNKMNKQTSHPTEKPENLTQRLIEIFTNKWDIVLDSFGGWWTTGVAAYKCDRNSITIEKEDEFIKIISDRQKRVERMKK